MISTTEFSLISPDGLRVYTFALLQILDFMKELTAAAFGEEGLNNVPLSRNDEKALGKNSVDKLTQEKSYDRKPDL